MTYLPMVNFTVQSMLYIMDSNKNKSHVNQNGLQLETLGNAKMKQFAHNNTAYLNEENAIELETSGNGKVKQKAPSAPKEEGHCMAVPDRFETIIINVGGTLFETLSTHLPNTPGNVLYNLSPSSQNYRAKTNDYFFDRDPVVFREVLNFYRTGEFHVPLGVCGYRTKRELKFWGISEELIEGCCGALYNSFCDHQDAYMSLKKDMCINKTRGMGELMSSGTTGKCSRVRDYVWRTIDNPRTSKFALTYCLLVSLISVTLVISGVLESVEEFQMEVPPSPRNMSRNDSRSNNQTGEDAMVVIIPELVVIEIICVGLLTVDFILRVVSCPNKCSFFKSPINVIDLLSILPFYLDLLIIATLSLSKLDINIVLTIGKIFQVMRIFRVIKYYSGFRLLVQTINASVKEIVLFFIMIASGTLVYSSLIHYVEPENFPDIPTSCWWAVVTMTTVGYGDMYPKTAGGYVVGTLCTMSGLLLVAFTVPILANNFILYYSQMSFIRQRKSSNVVEMPTDLI